jgi:rRNA maturation RNase YbeY
MEIRISGNISEVAEDLTILKDITEWTCRKLALKPDAIDVILIDDAVMQEMHKIYLDDPSKTDVMTFNLGENEQIEGEIYISLPRAQSQAKDYNVNLRSELARLIIHGCLHLAGYDDQTPEDRDKMKQLEDSFVQEVTTSYASKISRTKLRD